MGIELSDLERALGYEFADAGLLRRAMSHRSWIAESGDTLSNERLEFIGDAVLGWVVADLAYHHPAGWNEGTLTDVRKSVVNSSALADVAREIGLGDHILLGRGEDSAGGRDKESILSDAMEAVIGAVYLDGGPQNAFELIERVLGERLRRAPDALDRLDVKSALQEFLASEGRSAPVYTSHSAGPDHERTFTVSVSSGGVVLGSGEGRSKKAAEQQAAGVALDALNVESRGASRT